jgi:YD repeat-containing protein
MGLKNARPVFLASLLLVWTPIFAQQQAGTATSGNMAVATAPLTTPSADANSPKAVPAPAGPHKLGQLNLTVNWRVRTEAWDFFQPPAGQSAYAFEHSLLRIGIGQKSEAFEWLFEGAADAIVDLPPSAVQPGRLGQLGLGGTYFAANGSQRNNVNGFVKQAYIGFKIPANGRLKLGRFTFLDGAEMQPKDKTLATTISYSVNSGLAVNKTLTYFDTGNVQTITDVNNGVTTYSYSTDTTKTCGNSFPTQMIEAISTLIQKFIWNCNGGVSTSVQDENGNSVSTTYSDADFWRPASTIDRLNNSTTFTYSGQTQVESTMNFNNPTSTSDTLVTLDGLGRTHITQTKQSQSSSTYDSVETDYDALSRAYKVTVPYSATAHQLCSVSCNATTTTYDALGRPLTVTDAGGGKVTSSYSQNDVLATLSPKPSGENSTKSRQMEYDGIGRLTSVCELTTTLPGNGTCAQKTSQTGYWTKYTYNANGKLTGVTQNAQSGSQQTRSYSYDYLGRMTSETNPELGASGNGTVNYTYDTDSTCGTSYGDLVKIVDAAGNVTCNTYDALHRITGSTFPNSSVTPSGTFVYDSATVNNVTTTYCTTLRKTIMKQAI